MTKLMEWLVVLGTTFFLWLGLLTNKLDNNFAKQYPDLLLWSPVIFVLLFGLYAASTVLYRTLTFNNCEEAATELQKQIQEAKRDLARLGFKSESIET